MTNPATEPGAGEHLPELTKLLGEGAKELVVLVRPQMDRMNADNFTTTVTVSGKEDPARFRVTFTVDKLLS